MTWVKSRHTFKGGIVLEYSGEDDFDQINVQPIPGSTNNQNGRFEFRNSGTGAHRRRHRRRGDGPLHELRRDRPARADQVAGARDRLLRPGLVEADRAT